MIKQASYTRKKRNTFLEKKKLRKEKKHKEQKKQQEQKKTTSLERFHQKDVEKKTTNSTI